MMPEVLDVIDRRIAEAIRAIDALGIRCRRIASYGVDVEDGSHRAQSVAPLVARAAPHPNPLPTAMNLRRGEGKCSGAQSL